MDLSPISSVAAQAGLAGSPVVRANQSPAEQRAAVAGQFEAIMLRQMLSQSVGNMLGGEDSTSGSIYGYMLTDVFASKLASGGGMGLAKVIAGQLAPKGAAAAAGPDGEDNQ